MLEGSRNFYDKQNDVVIEGVYIVTRDFDPGQSLEEQPEKVLDIQNMVLSLSMYEDIGSMFLNGEIKIADRINLIDQMPLSGNEFIVIFFRSPLENEPRRVLMKISGQKSRVRSEGSKTDILVLRLESEGHSIDSTQYESAYFKGTCEGMVQDIIDTYNLNYSRYEGAERRLGFVIQTGIFFEPTTNEELEFCFPFQRPSQMIKTIAQCAKPKDNPSPAENSGYLFFETIRGYNFVSVNTLMRREPRKLFTQLDILRIMDTDSGETSQFSKRTEEMPLKILGQSGFDRISQQKVGALSSLNYYHDITTKKWGGEVYQYQNDYKALEEQKPTVIDLQNTFLPIRRRYPIINELDPSGLSPTKTNLVNLQTDLKSETGPYFVTSTHGEEHYKNQRFINSNISMLGETQYEVTVSGASELSAGDTVYLRLSKNSTPRPGANDLDEEKSGVYLIKSLHHFFVIGSDDVQSFKTSMRVVRNYRHDPVPTSPNMVFEGVI
jgi:hypothetical protein